MAQLLTKLKLIELALVDSPACKQATVSIFKRADDAPPADLKTVREDGDPPAPPAIPTDPPKETPTMTDLEKALAQNATLTANIADLQKQLETATAAIAKAATEKAEADGKVVALEKAAEIAKTDEVFEAEGQMVRKSEVGAPVFAIMKAQAERIEKAEFQKAAETREIGSLPGTTVEKGDVLHSVSRIKDEAVRKSLDAMLKAGGAALADAMKASGRTLRSVSFEKAADELDALAAKYAAEKDVSKAAAMDAVLKTEDGKKLYDRQRQERIDRSNAA